MEVNSLERVCCRYCTYDLLLRGTVYRVTLATRVGISKLRVTKIMVVVRKVDERWCSKTSQEDFGHLLLPYVIHGGISNRIDMSG
jgi:hypothetical protein